MKAGDRVLEIGAGPGRFTLESASNWASLGDAAAVARIASSPTRWETFLSQEERMCQEPGALDGETHLLFAAIM